MWPLSRVGDIDANVGVNGGKWGSDGQGEGTTVKDMGTPRRRPDALGREIASLLREQTARHELSQRELGRRANISSSQINLYLRGERSPTLDEFADICDTLNVRPEVVMGLANHNIRWREQHGLDDDSAVPVPDPVKWNLRSINGGSTWL